MARAAPFRKWSKVAQDDRCKERERERERTSDCFLKREGPKTNNNNKWHYPQRKTCSLKKNYEQDHLQDKRRGRKKEEEWGYFAGGGGKGVSERNAASTLWTSLANSHKNARHFFTAHFNRNGGEGRRGGGGLYGVERKQRKHVKG